MFSTSEIALFRAISPVHAGTGTELGIVDMPIQKDPNTNLAKFESSTIKGSLRNHMTTNSKPETINNIFGSGNDNTQESNDINAGKVSFSDAKLLFYPIKCDKDFYKLVTCESILNNLFALIKLSNDKINLKLKTNPSCGQYYTISSGATCKSDIYLDSYKFNFEGNLEIENLSNSSNIFCNILDEEKLDKYIVLNDNDFIDLIEINRFIITRNKIDENTGITKDGGLFTEEYLPEETILYSLFYENQLSNNSQDTLNQKEDNKDSNSLLDTIFKSCKYFQLGGNASLGKGIIKLKSLKLKEEK